MVRSLEKRNKVYFLLHDEAGDLVWGAEERETRKLTKKKPQLSNAERSLVASSSAESDANRRWRSMVGTGSGISAPASWSSRLSCSGIRYRLGGSCTVAASSCTRLGTLHDSSAIGFD